MNGFFFLCFFLHCRWRTWSSWSAATANSLVQVGSTLYGVGNLIGDIIVSVIEKSTEGVGNTEETLLAALEAMLTFLRGEKRRKIGIREALDSLFDHEESEEGVERHMAIILGSKTEDEGLSYIAKNLTDRDVKRNFNALVEEAFYFDSSPEYTIFGRPSYTDQIWAAVKFGIEQRRQKVALKKRLPHPTFALVQAAQ